MDRGERASGQGLNPGSENLPYTISTPRLFSSTRPPSHPPWKTVRLTGGLALETGLACAISDVGCDETIITQVRPGGPRVSINPVLCLIGVTRTERLWP